MTSPWQMLAGNLAVVALVVLCWGHARFWLRGVHGVARSALFGATMGFGAVASMLMGAEIGTGYLVDLRYSLIAVSAFFGGPVAALISLSLAMGWRMEMGGSGVTAGLFLMVFTTGLGLGARVLFRKNGPSVFAVLCLSAAVTLLVAAPIFLVPHESMAHAFANSFAPMAVLNQVATTLAGLVVLQARRLAAERDLMSAAMVQSPDYSYVKDRHGRFAVVNQGVAEFNGFARPRDMIGKTDFDLTNQARAQTLFAIEQRIIRGGQAQLDMVEQLQDNLGRMRWFSTSKVPLHSASGEMIGLAGVTRDITDERQLRQDLIDSRNTLSFAMAEMSDGLAMFDSEGRIEFCNEQYREAFPYTGTVRQPGTHMRDILKAVISTGEQLSAPKQVDEKWIKRMVDNLHRESEEEVHLFDGRWLQIRTRPTSEGKTLAVVTDVTRIKQAEMALHSATDQLKHLVRTDGLTGLLNRRAFDDAMDAEIARSARAGTPMSLLLIDVDHFKAYNDEYGHPSGDECLKLVANHLQKSLKRSADLAVRYGGEEFAAILPETDEDGAYLVAESFRKTLAGARLPHRGSERGILTASVGVATYMPDNLRRSTGELIQVADEALYSAKAAGRDRVYGTRVRGQQAKYAHE